MHGDSHELEGLSVHLDELRYQYGGPNVPPETPHVFIYFLTIANHSDRAVKLLGRKWIIQDEEGETLVVEGDKIVGETPCLIPGESFSYNSYHVTGCDARVVGSFHGFTASGLRVHVILPPFDMRIPSGDED